MHILDRRSKMSLVWEGKAYLWRETQGPYIAIRMLMFWRETQAAYWRDVLFNMPRFYSICRVDQPNRQFFFHFFRHVWCFHPDILWPESPQIHRKTLPWVGGVQAKGDGLHQARSEEGAGGRRGRSGDVPWVWKTYGESLWKWSTNDLLFADRNLSLQEGNPAVATKKIAVNINMDFWRPPNQWI